jgi:tetratricopeptide (TPR) repeat protein
MEKYRVRLKTGRVVGPFLNNQILEMKEKGHIRGSEDCQIYPTGDWLPLNTFEFWNSKADNKPLPVDGTFVVDLAKIKNSEQVKEIEEENIPVSSTEQNIEINIESKPSPSDFLEFDYKNVSESESEEIQVEPVTREEARNDESEKTVVRKVSSVVTFKEEDSFDKTIVKTEAIQWKAEQEKIKKEKEEQAKKVAEEKQRKEIEEEENRIDLDTDSTQAISLNELKSKISIEAKKSEEELLQVEEIVKKEKKRKEKIEAKKKQDEIDEEENEENEVNKKEKKKKIIIIVAILIVAAFLFPEEDKQEKKKVSFIPLDPVIEFPVPFDTADEKKANELIASAKTNLQNGTYSSKVKAAIELRKAYENNSSDKKTLAKMMRVYAEILPHSSEFERDGGILFKLLQSNRVLLEVEPDVAHAAGLFYRSINKLDAGFEVIDRFVKSKSNNPTKEIFASYLDGLVSKDNEKKADEVSASLEKAPARGVDVNLSLVNYYRYKNYIDKAKSILDQAIKESPNSVPVLISQSEFFLEDGEMKKLAENAVKIKELNAEGSRLYYGRLLEFQGFLMAFQDKPAEAAKLFTESLKFNDSDTLRDKLTNIKNIDSTANDEATKLIKQVKARVLIKEASSDLENYNFESALLKALNAYSLNSGYLKADLFLADLQMKLGMAKDALETLEELQRRNPKDAVVNFGLLKAYIQNYKFNDAKRMIVIMASSELREDWRYSSLNAMMYEMMGDLNQSILWLQKAINLNPLEDENMYALAKLFLRAKKFSQAKNNLFKAMELNPSYIEYKLAYAAIIYETDGVDKAIDYLFGLRSQFKDNPAILGEIAIYYYRAGKNQQFIDTKNDINKLPRRDARVYRFLIKAAVLDEKWDDAIEFTEELLKLEPGDLAAMMDAGKLLMKLKKYKEAALWFVRLREKLPTYPRVGYYKARIELYVGNIDQALLDVREDMKMNGDYEDGLNLAGDILYLKEDYQNASNEYKKSLRLNTRSYGALRGLADIAFKQGNMDVAVDLYRRALSEMKEVQEPEIYRKMGDLYRLTGQQSLAIESYQVYLKLNPDAADKSTVEQHIRVME